MIRYVPLASLYNSMATVLSLHRCNTGTANPVMVHACMAQPILSNLSNRSIKLLFFIFIYLYYCYLPNIMGADAGTAVQIVITFFFFFFSTVHV